MFNFLKFWKSSKKNPKTIAVFFDGDQITSKILKQFLDKRQSSIRYVWIQSGKNKPRLLDSQIEYCQAPSFGKEATDMMLSILITKYCCENPDLREVHVVSGDGDMINMTSMLAGIFHHITFYVLHPSTRELKRGTKEYLATVPHNCKFVKFFANKQKT